MEQIRIGSQFSGVGAFDEALKRLGIDYLNVYQAEWDKFARTTYLANNEQPKYYVEDVHDTPIREITEKYGSLDIFMSSPPCQAFSLAGKRLGEDDERGILFYQTHKFIKINRPRFFIIENVKGLLSDDGGKTFGRWQDLLGGKSINGNPMLFPNEESVPYHIYWDVLNAKDFGVPQNRERVFIVGIRDDADNNFSWPKPFPLEKRLKDILEDEVDEKYYLSEKMVKYFTDNQKGKGNGRATDFLDGSEQNTGCLLATYYKQPKDGIYIKVKSATKQGFEVASEGDSINLSQLNSETRRGRVGKGVSQTLDTSCNQAVMIGAFRGRNPENTNDRTTGAPMQQTLEINKHGTSNTITSVQKDNVVVQLNPSRESRGRQPYKQNRIYDADFLSPVLDTECGRPSYKIGYRIRKLTPRECFRLMDFPESFSWPVSNSQAYKQAGNSIVVGVLVEIIKNLKL